MPGEIIGMEDMMAIYEVTDRFEIDRETISVPLEKLGDGSVTGERGRDHRDRRARVGADK